MTFQCAEPLLGLASLQHGYFAPPGDHRLELTVANGFENHLFFNHLAGTGDLFDAISSEPFPTTVADKRRLANTLIVNLRDIELAVCMVSPAGASYIPRLRKRYPAAASGYQAQAGVDSPPSGLTGTPGSPPTA
eukprot:COSAG02_NODE_6952_length_3266_cov_7.514683_5_plen_134_part_00